MLPTIFSVMALELEVWVSFVVRKPFENSILEAFSKRAKPENSIVSLSFYNKVSKFR
jgi:hypothetical protein